METLKNKHLNTACWIIGKGQSLALLSSSDIGEGIVITLNQAITKVEPLGLPNLIYSMQKDGGIRRHPSITNLVPDCDYKENCGYICGGLILPNNATLLLHDQESKYCFSDYSPRYVLSLEGLGLSRNVASFIFAIHMARYMGCNKFNFVSFDGHLTGDFGTNDDRGKALYQEQVDMVPEATRFLECEWITPSGEGR